MKPQKRAAASIALLLLLAGCGGNVIDWADETFYQSKIHTDYQKVIKPFLKSRSLYDLFDTVAMFDVLWLSDTVRTAYAQVYGKMTGKDEDGYVDFLRRELSANTYFVSFYVLSLREICLTDTPAFWTVHLEVDGKKYLPADIKAVDLSAEYLGFFGKLINKHKNAYEVRFDKKDVAGNDILEGKKEIKLYFSSARFYGVMEWDLAEDERATLPAFVVTGQEKPVETVPAKPKRVPKIRRSNRVEQHDMQKQSQPVAADKVSVYATEGSVPVADAQVQSNAGGGSLDDAFNGPTAQTNSFSGPTDGSVQRKKDDLDEATAVFSEEGSTLDGGVGGFDGGLY